MFKLITRHTIKAHKSFENRRFFANAAKALHGTDAIETARYADSAARALREYDRLRAIPAPPAPRR